jgi:putative membrane protein
MELIQKTDLRDALAAERTFLAWIRTGLALMGFGFVVARFGLFLTQFKVVQHLRSGSSYGLSLWFGTALIAVGVLVFLLSAWHHIRLVRELDRGGVPPSRPSTQVVGIALFLAMVGLAMTIYLVSVRDASNVLLQDKLEVSMTPTTAIAGIVDKPSNHSVDETVDLCSCGPQRRGGEGWNENASYKVVDLWQSKGRHSADARRTQHRH